MTTTPAATTSLAAGLVNDAIVLPPMRGPQIHSTSRWRRGMLKVTSPGAPTTTRQAEVLNTALIGSPTDERGLLVGDDTMSSSMVTHDQFTAYEDKKITSPNVVVLGMVGAGKSTLLKVLYVERPLLLRAGARWWWTRRSGTGRGSTRKSPASTGRNRSGSTRTNQEPRPA